MADPDKGRKNGKRRQPSRKKKGKNGKRAGLNGIVSSEILSALDSDLRRRILRVFDASMAPLSPVQISNSLDIRLSSVSYHVHVLKECGLVVIVDERPVRGALEHFYAASSITDCALIKEILEVTKVEDEA